MNALERRKHVRIVLDEKTKVGVDPKVQMEKAFDLSERGIQFECAGEVTKGQTITVTFQLSDTLLVELEAEVMRTSVNSKGKLVGARFLETSHRHAVMVFNYMTKRQ